MSITPVCHSTYSYAKTVLLGCPFTMCQRVIMATSMSCFGNTDQCVVDSATGPLIGYINARVLSDVSPAGGS
jgi:hypothetical protein